MAKKGRHRKGGRATPKGTHQAGYRPRYDEWPSPPIEDEEPGLMDGVLEALSDRNPVTFLLVASRFFDATDPRNEGPFAHDDDDERVSREELVDAFTEIDIAETTALLSVFARFAADDVLARRLLRAVASRTHRLPAWIAGMDAAVVERTLVISHVLGDGDDIVVGVRLGTGEQLAALVYIDHNVGTLVKDAFVVDGDTDELQRIVRTHPSDPDMTIADIDPADAKARITDAIRMAAMTYPAFESDTWPECRPLVEWIAGLLPDGGRGYERPEWSERERSDLADRFFASELGRRLGDDDDHRSLLESLVWFGCDYGPGDPMRWSPVAVEMLLADWIPRKIVAPADYLAKAPEVLRAFVRFCHDERGIRPSLTAETIAAVDRWEPGYQQAVRSPRPQGAGALLAAIGAGDNGVWDGDAWDDDHDDFDEAEFVRATLERAVGGADALATLDDAPLPDEPFEWEGIAPAVRDRVGEVVALCDGTCDHLLDHEHRTAVRRLLARIAWRAPEVFRRKGRTETAAAALCWAVARANGSLRASAGGLTAKALAAHLGVSDSGVTQRAATLLRAGGFEYHTAWNLTLGSPDYLVARARRRLINSRDYWADLWAT